MLTVVRIAGNDGDLRLVPWPAEGLGLGVVR